MSIINFLKINDEHYKIIIHLFRHPCGGTVCHQHARLEAAVAERAAHDGGGFPLSRRGHRDGCDDATALIALLFFREKVSKRPWAAIALVTAASILLSLDGTSTSEALRFSKGLLLVLGATVC